MNTIVTINDRSKHLDAVKQLWRAHSDTLGFFTAGAFTDYAKAGHALVALKDKECVGYVLYRITKDWVVIAHFCVAPHVRKQGFAKAMLTGLIEKTRKCRGIVLSCRNDFEASKTWPRLGFHIAGEIPGRAASGSILTRWMYDYGHPNLFEDESPPGVLEVTMDVNVFLDLVDDRNAETDGLRADWLTSLIRLCYTAELLNEIGRNADATVRKQRKTQAQQFKLLTPTPESFNEAETELRPLFPTFASAQDESDFRQLVRALACSADAFVTRDEELLSRADDVYRICGLQVVRPAELIGRIDVIAREREYQSSFVAGTREISQARISESSETLTNAILLSGEKPRTLTAKINAYLSNPQKNRCVKITDRAGALLAFYAAEQEKNLCRIPILRLMASRRAATLVRTILTGLVRQAAKLGTRFVLISEPNLNSVATTACADLGFLPVNDGQLKIVLPGLINVDDMPKLIEWNDPSIAGLSGLFPSAKHDIDVASRVEHLFWPAKLMDAALPCFIVPIRPQFAEHLFDEKLAKGGLFGADVDLALNPESAYYSAAKSPVITCPSRILWYVSSSKKYQGTMSIRACSRLVEVVTDIPKNLFTRFRRLGVYEWRHVRDKARGDLSKHIMAFRFDDTEVLPPVSWLRMQQILQANGVSTTLVSPVSIKPTVFNQIYAAAFNPS